MRDNSIHMMPYGYHTVVSAPGYTTYYLWFLAGEQRVQATVDDPKPGLGQPHRAHAQGIRVMLQPRSTRRETLLPRAARQKYHLPGSTVVASGSSGRVQGKPPRASRSASV
jgi:hypothetical protein